ncbi:MAG: hypothetical protein KGZ50_10670 [Peptococcaceae bacterium]|nr:hypothetical protein [Peptococcaceae bacterium]
MFHSFLPAVSNKAKKEMKQTVREWRLHMQTRASLKELAAKYNAVIRSKNLQRRQRCAAQWLRRIAQREPKLFAHWSM